MMAVKAWAFSDTETLKAILREKEPKVQKALGRKVADFQESVWDTICIHVVAAGTLLAAKTIRPF